MFNPKKEFSRFAHRYCEQNIIQKEIAKELVSYINNKKYRNILELGCGNGEIYSSIDNKCYDTYTAVDISTTMCDLHPKSETLDIINADFDDNSLYQDKRYDLVISSSALQWSKDINTLFANISKVTNNIALAIFTSNTFKSIHQLANITSPIYDSDVLIKNVIKYFEVDIIIKTHKLYFNKKYDIFRYIKTSGISGGTNRLSYKAVKNLIEQYPYDYLEFEIIFFVSKEM